MASERLLSDAAIDCLLGWAFGDVRGPGWLETPARAGTMERHAVDVDGPTSAHGWERAWGLPIGTLRFREPVAAQGEG